MSKLICFDLDGTLVNTSRGIFNCVRFAEKNMGLKPIPDADLRKFVGPPPRKNYMELYGLSEDKAFEAVQFHRQYGATKGYLEADIYDGIKELLDDLKGRGFKLAVTTLKFEPTAVDVLKNAGIADLFDTIVGQNAEESLSKADTIHIALERTGTKEALLVGDSQYDYEGAVAAGADFVGVLYGFGFDREHAYDFVTADKVEDIISKVLN